MPKRKAATPLAQASVNVAKPLAKSNAATLQLNMN
jgi:hypothetical protein